MEKMTTFKSLSSVCHAGEGVEKAGGVERTGHGRQGRRHLPPFGRT